MKRLLFLSVFMLTFSLGCSKQTNNDSLLNVGLLVPTTINDPVWGSKGYKGLLNIQSQMGVDVFYKESVQSVTEVRNALTDFENDNVNLVYGHGSEYEALFRKVHKDFPDMHFIYFNGDFSAENVTSITFESYAMGFFGGMVASKMSETKHIGIIAAFDWQPEIKGFIDGAKFQDSSIQVTTKFTENWDDTDKAMSYLQNMLQENADVFYPAGDSFNLPIIQKVKAEGLYVIGFISDQSDLGEATVLTSTVQHVDRLYELTAEQFVKNELNSGVLSFDFQDNVITMGKFSSDVPEEFQKQIKEYVETYKTTGKLPNEK